MAIRFLQDTTANQVVLNGIPLTLAPVNLAWHGSQVFRSGSRLSEQERQINLPAPVEAILPMAWTSWHYGMGVSRREEQGTDFRYNYGFGFDARFPRMLTRAFKRTDVSVTDTVSTAGQCVDFFEIGSQLYGVHGRHIIQFNLPTDDTLSDAEDFGSGNACTDTQEFDGAIYAAMGAGNLQRSTNGTTWNPITGTINADYLAEGRDRLFTGRGNDARNAQDPTDAANFTAIQDVDSSGKSITGIAPYGAQMVFAKTDGLWELDEAMNPQALMKWVSGFTETDNGKKAGEWNGFLLYPNVTGLSAFRGGLSVDGISTPVGPESIDTNLSLARGKCTAWVAWGFWIFAAFLNKAGDTYIMAARPLNLAEQETGNAPRQFFVWHTLDKLTALECRAMHITHITTNPRLYIGRGSNVSYYIMPRYGTALVDEAGAAIDTTVRFATGGQHFLEAHDGLAPNTSKIFRQVEIESIGMTSTDYVKVYYRIDGGAWTFLGNARSSPRTTLRFSESVSGHRIELRLDDTGSDATVTYAITSIIITGLQRPPQIPVVSLIVLAENDMMTRQGQVFPLSSAQLIATLRGYAENRTVLTLLPPFGIPPSKMEVVVIPPVEDDLILMPVENRGNGSGSLSESTSLLVIKFTVQVVRFPGQVARYNVNDLYNGGKVYK